MNTIISPLYTTRQVYETLCKKNTTPVCQKTQGGKLQTKNQSKVEIVFPEQNAMKGRTWNFKVYEQRGNHKQDIILGCDILSKLKIDPCFSNSTIRINGGTYEGCTAPMKKVTNIK